MAAISTKKVNGPQRTSLVMLTARLVHGVIGLAAPRLVLLTQMPPSLVLKPERGRSRYLLNTTESHALQQLNKSGAQRSVALLICNFLIGTIGNPALQPAVAVGSRESGPSRFILVVAVMSSRNL